MIAAVQFWLAKPLAEALAALAIIVIVLLAGLPRMIRQARCRHNGDVAETSACDAICRDCGKNLGFIGTWRAKRKDGAA